MGKHAKTKLLSFNFSRFPVAYLSMVCTLILFHNTVVNDITACFLEVNTTRYTYLNMRAIPFLNHWELVVKSLHISPQILFCLHI